MCYIAVIPRGVKMSYSVYKRFAAQNSDGVGVAVHEDDGHWSIHKGITQTAYKRAWKILVVNHQKLRVLHFRFSTAGDVNWDNCHPHKTPKGAYVVHNGTIPHLSNIRRGMSDTAALASYLWDDMNDSEREEVPWRCLELNREGIKYYGQWYDDAGMKVSQSSVTSYRGYYAPVHLSSDISYGRNYRTGKGGYYTTNGHYYNRGRVPTTVVDDGKVFTTDDIDEAYFEQLRRDYPQVFDDDTEWDAWKGRIK